MEETITTGPLDRFPLTPHDQVQLDALRARMESGAVADGDPCPPDCPWCRTEIPTDLQDPTPRGE